jgi:hypothetical protein
MINPSVATTMEGEFNYVCVGDHAADGSATENAIKSRRPPRATAQITLQFYAFDCLGGNLNVSEHTRQYLERK